VTADTVTADTVTADTVTADTVTADTLMCVSQSVRNWSLNKLPHKICRPKQFCTDLERDLLRRTEMQVDFSLMPTDSSVHFSSVQFSFM